MSKKVLSKNDLVSLMVDKAGSSKAEASKWLNCFLETFVEAVKAQDEIRLPGVFTLKYRDVPKTERLNHLKKGADGKPVTVVTPAHTRASVVLSKGIAKQEK